MKTNPLVRIAEAAERLAEHTSRPVTPRTEPKRLSAAMLIRAVPNAGDFFKRVPSEYVDGETVKCPCGERPAPIFGALVRCTGDDCDRVYLLLAPARLPDECAEIKLHATHAPDVDLDEDAA
jgi:hypothetical protein